MNDYVTWPVNWCLSFQYVSAVDWSDYCMKQLNVTSDMYMLCAKRHTYTPTHINTEKCHQRFSQFWSKLWYSTKSKSLNIAQEKLRIYSKAKKHQIKTKADFEKKQMERWTVTHLICFLSLVGLFCQFTWSITLCLTKFPYILSAYVISYHPQLDLI